MRLRALSMIAALGVLAAVDEHRREVGAHRVRRERGQELVQLVVLGRLLAEAHDAETGPRVRLRGGVAAHMVERSEARRRDAIAARRRRPSGAVRCGIRGLLLASLLRGPKGVAFVMR